MPSVATTVLLPGLTCDESFWSGQLEALRRDRTVVVPTLHDCRSIYDMATAALDSVSGPLDVVGHSMGGRVALAMYRRASDRFHSIALLDTGVHPPSADEPVRRQKRLDIATQSGMGALADDWIPNMIHPDRQDDRALTQAIRAMVTSYTVDQYHGQINALLTRVDERPTLAKISCRALVACGSDDAWSPPEQHQRIARGITGATTELVDNAGHMIAMEQPEATLSLLQTWLQAPCTP